MAPAVNTVNAAENLPPWMTILFFEKKKKSCVFVYIYKYIHIKAYNYIYKEKLFIQKIMVKLRL